MLKGDLTTTPIETVLTDLANEEATGCLHVVDDDGDEALVYLKTGLVYAVSVPGQRPALGARLISSNALVPENLAEALEAQRTELQGWRLGELLVHLGFVEQDVVEAFVQEQVRDGFTDLMTWRSGRWRFRKSEKTREDVAPPTPLTTLLELVHARQATWHDIVSSVHGPNAVPMLAARGGEADITLDPDTWSLLCKIDGERSLAELARECGFTLFEAGNVVRALVEAGLVDVEEDLGPDSDPVSPVSVVTAVSDEAAEAVDDGADDGADDASDAEFSRAAALAAAFALSNAESDDAVSDDAVSDDDAILGDAASAEESSTEIGDADAGPETPANAESEVPSLLRVSDAFAKAFTAPTDPSSFVDPFHVPDEIRLRPSPKRGNGPALPTEEEQRRERIRQAAAAELAAAHAEAEAMRKGQAGASGHIADVVNLEARREAARVEAERREAERLEAERLEAERLEAERLEAERLEAERLEAERLEAERLEAERLEAERLEAERLEAERLEAERLEAERLAAEEAARLEAERLEAERLEAERLEA
ncbi:MAG TPA: DUF4388 domain-containing protein, partial [Solirubrobacterales bacterium]|nr:DUF4388 domain-containing protein [Solirubrobacterales bacterium]